MQPDRLFEIADLLQVSLLLRLLAQDLLLDLLLICHLGGVLLGKSEQKPGSNRGQVQIEKTKNLSELVLGCIEADVYQ